MKRCFYMLLTFIATFCTGFVAASQTAPDWKTVEYYDSQSLPKSALETVDKIYRVALNKGDNPTIIKALIHKMKYQTAIDSDSLPTLIAESEAVMQKIKDKTAQAVMYSMMAELYSMYYLSSPPTPLPTGEGRNTAVAYPPLQNGEGAGGEVTVWTANIFLEKITDYLLQSLAPVNELQAVDALQYKDILTEGESSRRLRPTLYDFLAWRAIDLLTQYANNYQVQNIFPQTRFTDEKYFAPVDEFLKLNITPAKCNFAPTTLKIYQDILKFRRSANSQQALVMADLERLEFVKNFYAEENSTQLYLAALEKLEKKYEKYDFCVEIIFKEAMTDNTDTQNDRLKRQYEICIAGINKYPAYDRIGLLKNLLAEITQTGLTNESKKVYYPKEDLSFKIHYTNIQRLVIEIYKIEAPVTVYNNISYTEGQYRKRGKLIDTKTFTLNNETTYSYYDTTLTMPGQDLGLYEYVIHTEDDKERLANGGFSVSRLATVTRAVDGKYDFVVADRVSGKPLKGAKINLYKKNNQITFVQSLTTNENGIASGGKKGDADFYNASMENDTSLVMSTTPWISNYSGNTWDDNTRVNIFTDRAIYRPGQTVYFKGIAYNYDNSKVLASRYCKVTLYDANGKAVSEKEVATNSYGSFSGSFVLPQGKLNGLFSIRPEIRNSDGDWFLVEEYKRPSFDILFDKNDKICRFGEKAKVSGSAQTFSGVSIQNVKVEYRVMRSYHGFCRIWRQPVQVASGEVLTDENGKFEISFLPEKAFEDKGRQKVAYIYTVSATVTDSRGETQTSETSLNIGNIAAILSVSGFTIQNKDSITNIKIEALNLSGNPVPVSGKYQIFALQPKDKNTLDCPEWIKGNLIIEKEFESGKEIDVAQIKQLYSGKYRIIASSANAETDSVDFTLYSLDDKRPPVPVYEWVVRKKTTCAVGEKAEIVYGSSAKDVYVLQEIFKDGKRLALSRFMLNNENRRIEIPFLESYGDGVALNFTFIKDSQVFIEEIIIDKKQPDRNLTLKMEVFRDKLLPGQQEEWKISVRDAAQQNVVSELLATMYDASLDKIHPKNWFFNPVKPNNISGCQTYSGKEFSQSSGNFWHRYNIDKFQELNYDRFNWFGFYVLGRYRNNVMYARASAAAEESRIAVDIADLAEPASVAFSKSKVVEDRILNEEKSSVQLRQNFAETAFFYPHLTTDTSGERLIRFTVPESNTAWKFFALAHTKDLKYGTLIAEAISQKPLMVSPNIPRFIREGDKTTITAAISNLSETAQAGAVGIEFFNPADGSATISVADAEKNFSVEAGKTVSVSWTFDVPKGIDLTAVKIVARSQNFSDGEQHSVPVLPRKMLVTESVAMIMNGKGEKTYTSPPTPLHRRGENSREDYKMTLEFSGNPVWYAVQALPAVSAPQTENIIDWFAAYYSNTVAQQIVEGNPKIKQVLISPPTPLQNGEGRISNLEKNQELKAMLLEETPWVTEANNETEQRERLALLFDKNRAENLSEQALEKIIALQGEDGGWAWFRGMKSSVGVTQWILWGFGEMKGVEGVKGVKERAVAFIDREIKRYYDDLKKKTTFPKITPTTRELEYLLVRSYYQHIPLDAAKEAHDFFLDLTERNWTKTTSLYARAIAAQILTRNGKRQTAEAIIKSLREHATTKPDEGMFWANNRASAFFFQSATCIHSFIMNAFLECGASPDEMDAMKLWLLRQKQTQQWENTPATVNAIQILLKTGGDRLANQGKVEIEWGDKTISTKQGEAGTGCVRETATRSEITPAMHSVRITKADDGPAWGALYLQYFEDMDKITASKTGLSVEKQLLTKNTPVRVGDKVTVRLTVRADRDYEYVALKDLRASCFEPADQVSGIEWKQNLIYYRSPKDASMNFYFDALPKGVYVFEYILYATAAGEYATGTATVQCLYAPEFVGHTGGGRILCQ